MLYQGKSNQIGGLYLYLCCGILVRSSACAFLRASRDIFMKVLQTLATFVCPEYQVEMLPSYKLFNCFEFIVVFIYIYICEYLL